MAKLNATNPLTGSKMNMSLGGIVSMLIGGLVLWFVAATSQSAARQIGNRVNNKYLDFEVDQLRSNEVKVVNSKSYMG